MKNYKNFWACLAILALLFTSCSKEEESGVNSEKATLSFGAIVADLTNKATTKQSAIGDLPACSEDAPAYVEIVLMQGDAEIVGTLDEPYQLDLVDGQVFTEEDPNLELDPGAYTLEHFAVYNEAGELIWIAPKGGVLAQFVDSPLPLNINLGAGVKKYVDVSVLCFDDREVNQYGYQFFELDIYEAFEFCFFANYCPPNGRHYPARYSVDISINGVLLYDDFVNEVGVNGDGDNFAEPLCFALPDLPQFADDVEYIDYTVTLLDWEGVYDAPEMTITGSLSRNEVIANFDGPNNVNYEHLRFGCDGTTPPNDDDNDGVPNDEDVCPGFDDNVDSDGDGIPDGCDPCPNVHSDNDNDGDCVPNNEDPCPNDVLDECAVEEGCETAFMQGDWSFITDADFTSDKWGWAEHWVDQGDGSFPIYAGAGQNDISKGDHIGNVVVTQEEGRVTLRVEWNEGVSVNDLHVYIGDTPPMTGAPGQFDNQNDSGVYVVEDDLDFWFAVHAEACYADLD